MLLVNPGSNIVREMDKIRLVDLVGRDNIFVNMNDAVVYCQGQLQVLACP